jgi:SOS response regulatory protein OraA/RecX
VGWGIIKVPHPIQYTRNEGTRLMPGSIEQIEVLTHKMRNRLTRYPTTTAVIRKSLEEQELPEEELEVIISTLTTEGFLNDANYAAEYVYSMRRKGKSPEIIRQELALKGVDEDTIMEALQESESDNHVEVERLAEELLVKELAKTPLEWGSTDKALRRTYGKLQRLGYDHEAAEPAITKALDSLLDKMPPKL